MHNRNDPSAPGGPRRTEPVLGNLDQIDTGGDRRDFARPARAETSARKPPFTARHQQAPRRHRRVPWWAIVIVLVLAGGGGWALTHQSTLSALLPQTQLNSLLTRADAAYAAGKLAGDPDRARDLYEAARARDPHQ
jgi:hypothetical protein